MQDSVIVKSLEFNNFTYISDIVKLLEANKITYEELDKYSPIPYENLMELIGTTNIYQSNYDTVLSFMTQIIKNIVTSRPNQNRFRVYSPLVIDTDGSITTELRKARTDTGLDNTCLRSVDILDRLFVKGAIYSNRERGKSSMESVDYELFYALVQETIQDILSERKEMYFDGKEVGEDINVYLPISESIFKKALIDISLGKSVVNTAMKYGVDATELKELFLLKGKENKQLNEIIKNNGAFSFGLH